MASIFFIMPLRLDSNVKAKRKFIIENFGNNIILPQDYDNNSQLDFDIKKAIETFMNVDLVIADLSFERPSCYFELGMAQAIGVPTYLIAEKGTQLHQHSGCVKFYNGLEEFRKLITSVIPEK